jgi:alpha-glucosidase
MLGDRFDPPHFRSQIEEFYSGAPAGWPTWAFSNHDVPRHVGRWKKHGVGREPLAKLAGALLLSLEGSVCLYQGEELGQTETELEYHELTDPQGIRFWPEDKGRDGCRTPMAWDAGAPNAGFSMGNVRPWLPVKAAQAANAVAGQAGQADSVLEFYRAMLRLRRETEELRTGRTAFFDVSEPVLAFTRGGTVLCVFNLSPERRQVRLEGGGEMALSQGVEHAGELLTLHPNGFAIMEVVGEAVVADADATADAPT